MSGSLPSARRSCHSSAPSAAAADRSCASLNSGFLVSGHESALPLGNRDTVSTPAEMNASPSPALIAWNAIREVCSDEEQYRLTVVPGRKSKPSSTATTRARLNPDSPPGWPQPRIRSSIWCGFNAGTLSSAARTICTARSSGRMLTSDPFIARPIGERAVETMTASGMVVPFRSLRVPRMGLARVTTG